MPLCCYYVLKSIALQNHHRTQTESSPRVNVLPHFLLGVTVSSVAQDYKVNFLLL